MATDDHLKTTMLTAGLALVTAGTALACPSGDDALAGIEIIYADGTRSVITRSPDGTVTEEEDLGDGTVNTYVAEQGILETAYKDSEMNGMDHFTYSFEVPTFKTIAPWSGNRGEQIAFDDAKTEVARVPFSWISRGRETRNVAGCTYDVIPFQITYFNPEGPTAVEFLWVPDLGVPINLGYFEYGQASPFVPEVIRKKAE